jgi:hypothetical protein
MARFDLNEYETVDQRIQRFYRTYPDGRIETVRLSKDEVPTKDDPHRIRWEVKASVFRTSDIEARPAGEGHAFEIDGGGGANKTSALENCETSAVGRALANAGLSGTKRTTREEMVKVKGEEVRQRIKAAQTEDDLNGIYNELHAEGIDREFLQDLSVKKKAIQALAATGAVPA